MPIDDATSLAPLLAHWRERPQRTWAVVATVFGDAIVPRGGTVWLATLVALFGVMGVDAGALRTAMSRLVADGWTERQRSGRNSAYALTPRGAQTFTAAAHLIYAAAPPAWDRRFHLVLHPADRDAAARAGFAQASPGLWVSPNPGNVQGDVTLEATATPDNARLLAARTFPLDRLAGSYARFNHAFAALPGWRNPAPVDAMVARTLLIHEYRRILLHAPALPAELLPPVWPGAQARALCAASYATLLPASEAWLTEHGLPPATRMMQHRFVEPHPPE